MDWLQQQLGFQDPGENEALALMQLAIEACVEARRRFWRLPEATYIHWVSRMDEPRRQIEQRVWVGELPLDTPNPDCRFIIRHPVTDVSRRALTQARGEWG